MDDTFPARIVKPHIERILAALLIGLLTGLLFGLGGGLVAGLRGRHTGLAAGLVIGLGGGSAFGLAAGLVIGLVISVGDVWASDSENTSSLGPIASWRADRSYLVVTVLVTVLSGALAVWLRVGHTGPATVLPGALAAGLLLGLVIGLTFGLLNSLSWPTALAIAQLARNWRTPICLMKFLDDAHQRDVLRTAGLAYQFRHARLQDRLAMHNDGQHLSQATDKSDAV